MGARANILTDDHETEIATVEPGEDEQGWKTADEIVKRWNAYPELVEALQEAKGTLAAIAEMSQRHDPETGFLRDLSPYDTYRSLLPCFQRLNALLDTLKTN